MAKITPVASYSLTVRLRIANQPGMLGKVTSAIGEAGGDIGAVDIVEAGGQTMTRDVTSGLADGRGHLAEHAGLVGDAKANGEAIACDRGVLAHGVAGLLAVVVRTWKLGERPRSASRPAGITGWSRIVDARRGRQALAFRTRLPGR